MFFTRNVPSNFQTKFISQSNIEKLLKWKTQKNEAMKCPYNIDQYHIFYFNDCVLLMKGCNYINDHYYWMVGNCLMVQMHHHWPVVWLKKVCCFSSKFQLIYFGRAELSHCSTIFRYVPVQGNMTHYLHWWGICILYFQIKKWFV